MNETFLFPCDKNWLKASLVLRMHQLKMMTEKLKQNAERYGVREGSCRLGLGWVGNGSNFFLF